MTPLLLLAAACPPWRAVWLPPPVYYYPPPVVFAACPCPVVFATPAAPVTPPAPPKPADPPARAEAPKAPPRVEADPTPFKPAAASDPPRMDPLVIPTTPPTTPAPKPAAPVVPTIPAPADPKAPDLKPVNPGGVEPPLVIPPPKESRTSFRLPDRLPTVRLVPAAGPAPASPDARRAVRFVNLTGSPVRLTVEGESATLPARHELTATVPAAFRWRLDDGESRTSEVPAAAPGADVVIR